MSGMDLNSIMDWLAKNGWWAVLTTVAILAGSYLTLFDRVGQYINRPKLTFQASKSSEPFRFNDKFEYDRIVFWINVKNEGNIVATQAKSFLKIKDESGVISIVKPFGYSPNESFPIHWGTGEDKRDTIDILTDKENYHGSIKIPLHFDIPLSYEIALKNALSQLTTMFDPPIANWNVLKAISPKDPKYHFSILVEIIVHYRESTKPLKQQFMIRVKHSQHFTMDSFEFYPVKGND